MLKKIDKNMQDLNDSTFCLKKYIISNEIVGNVGNT